MIPPIPWWICAGLAAAVALAEIHLPSGYFAWIAVGAALTAVATAAGIAATLAAQLCVFAAATALSCVVGYYVYGRIGSSENKSRLNQRNLLTVGDRGVVVVPIVNRCGKVRLGDSVWLAEGPNLVAGTAVVVVGVRGTCVIVEPAK
jgi:inner membrane protein